MKKLSWIFLLYVSFSMAENYVVQESIVSSDTTSTDLDSIKIKKYNNDIYTITRTQKIQHMMVYTKDNMSALDTILWSINNDLTQNSCCKSWSSNCSNFLLLQQKSIQAKKHIKFEFTKNICRMHNKSKITIISRSDNIVYSYQKNSFYILLNGNVSNSVYTFDDLPLSTMLINTTLKSKNIDLDQAINITSIAKKSYKNPKSDPNYPSAMEINNFLFKYIKPRIDIVKHY